MNPNAAGNEPQVSFLVADKMFEEPLWKSLSRQLDEFFFPKKLPPLKLESKPEPVKDIWGFYNNKRNGALGSTGVHAMLVVAIVLVTIWGRNRIVAAPAPKPTVMLVDPADIPTLKPGKTISGGGGTGWSGCCVKTPRTSESPASRPACTRCCGSGA